jgi:hypothetical protein
MIRRYDLTRSDNLPYTGRMTHQCQGNGDVFINTGFKVASSIVTWAGIISGGEGAGATAIIGIAIINEAEIGNETSQPRLYIKEMLDNGFTVRYENIPEDANYIEFTYIAF